VNFMLSIRKFAKAVLPLRLHPIMFRLRRQAAQSRNRQAELGSYATAVLTETPHGKLLVAATDLEVGCWLAQHGDYGLQEVRTHAEYLTSSSSVLVVGAHVGALLVPLAKLVSAAVGIEANPETFRLLQMNVLLNGLTNVKMLNIAAGDRNCDVKFLMRRSNTGASAVVAGEIVRGDPRSFADDPKIVKVPMRRLDDALTHRAFDLVIMDVEGCEFAALNGMPEILASSQRLQIEVVPWLAESRGQITGDQLADIVCTHFPVARVLGSPECGAKLEVTGDLIRGIFLQGRKGYDVLAQKRS
jgi:FkbM family methyltransferase